MAGNNGRWPAKSELEQGTCKKVRQEGGSHLEVYGVWPGQFKIQNCCGVVLKMGGHRFYCAITSMTTSLE